MYCMVNNVIAQPEGVYLCMSVSHPKKSKIIQELDVIYFPFKNISKINEIVK